MPEFIVENILTESAADQVVNDYIADGCTAEKEQTGGKWKVVANCPDS